MLEPWRWPRRCGARWTRRSTDDARPAESAGRTHCGGSSTQEERPIEPIEQDEKSAPAKEIQGEAAGDGAEQTAALRERLQELEQQNLRLLADFDNARRRMRRDEEESRQRIQRETVSALLPLADDLGRALEAADETDPLREGVALVERGLLQIIERLGATAIAARGEAFDPSLHEAVGAEESDEPPGTVLGELRRGYRMGDRVIRPALVRVAKARE